MHACIACAGRDRVRSRCCVMHRHACIACAGRERECSRCCVMHMHACIAFTMGDVCIY
jgi:hypothetical protein